MLGLGDRLQLLELFDAVMRGDAKGALDRFGQLYALGAEPVAVAQDLLELAHWLSRLKVAADAASGLGVAASAVERASQMARDLSLPVLARAWQMLLRGVDEIRVAPDARAAAEMLLLRIACVAELPSPAELARLLRAGDGTPAVVPLPSRPAPVVAASPRPVGGSARPVPVSVPTEPAEPVAAQAADPAGFAEFVARLRDGGEAPLAAWLSQSAHLIRFEPGRLELRFDAGVPTDVAGRIGEAAMRVLGQRWMVILGGAEGEATLAAQAAAAKAARMAELARDPALQEVLAAFPGATLVDIRPRGG
jgi:DNA polymerase-3 subunit gamma/tau